MRSENLNEAQKLIFFTAEVLEMSGSESLKWVVSSKSKLQIIFFLIFAPRLDFGYALKPKNSASDAIQ
jgi:hypothetical protein